MSLENYNAGDHESQKRPLIREDGKRLDGRELDELREVTMKVGVLSQANGSAYLTHGNNKILVAVYGPRELHPRHLTLANKARIRVEYRLATFSVGERKSPAPRRREHELSKVIAEAVEPSIFTERFPRAGIDIYIQVLDADGGTRAASITAASLALADAGIPLKGLVSSVAAGKAGGKIVLDLFDVEDKEGEADLPIAILSHNKEITLCQMDGNMSKEEFTEALEMAMKGCEKLHQMQREALLEKYKDISAQLSEDENGNKREPEKENNEEKSDIALNDSENKFDASNEEEN